MKFEELQLHVHSDCVSSCFETRVFTETYLLIVMSYEQSGMDKLRCNRVTYLPANDLHDGFRSAVAKVRGTHAEQYAQ